MNITTNIAPNFNNKYNLTQKQKHYSNSQPTFTGFNVSNGYDAFCHGVGKYFCHPILEFAPIKYSVDKLGYAIRNSENAVKHFLAVGSIITSGMYMKQTYTNKKMDEDRRKTLTVNQFFTLVLSTAGAYTLDGYLKSWWANQHEKYLRLDSAGNAVWDGMNEKNAEIASQNLKTNKEITAKVLNGEISPELDLSNDKELTKLVKKYLKSDMKFDKESKLGIFAQKLADADIKVEDPKDVKGLVQKCKDVISNGAVEQKEALKKAVHAENYVRKLIEPKIDITSYIEKFGEKHVVDNKILKSLTIRSKGFSALRSILVFGFIYRFFVPLAVVKPTNKLCEIYLEHKKAKQQAAHPENKPDINNILLKAMNKSA